MPGRDATLSFDRLEARRMLYADNISFGPVSSGASSSFADIAIDGQGRTKVAYVRDGSIVVRSYSTAGPSGGSFSETTLPGTNSSASLPRIAMNDDGDYVVVWHQLRDSAGSANVWDVYAYWTISSSSSGGGLSSGSFSRGWGRVSGSSPLDVAQEVRNRNPVVDIDEDGNIAVAWEHQFSYAPYPGATLDSAQVLVRVRDVDAGEWVDDSYYGNFQSGTPVYAPGGDPWFVDGAATARNPAIDVTEDGIVAVVWTSGDTATRGMVFGATPDDREGGMRLAEAVRSGEYEFTLFETERPSFSPDVAMLNDGLVVAYTTEVGSGQYFTGWERFGLDGMIQNISRQESTWGQVSANGDGGFSVAYVETDGTETRVANVNFDQSGVAYFDSFPNQWPSTRVSEYFPRIDSKGSRYAMLWADSSGSGEHLGGVYSIRDEPTIDLNGDRLIDGLWRDAISGSVVGTLYNAIGDVCCTRSLGGNSDWSIGSPGDFDGDGVTDFLWLQESTGLAVLRLNNADGSAKAAVITGESTDWELAGSGDYDGDGKTDVVWRHKDFGFNVMWLFDGLSHPRQAPIGGDRVWHLVAADHDFDVNGDGRTDLIWRQATTGVNIIKRMNGFNEISATVLPGGGSDWEIVATGDYDADGSSDVLWRQASTGTVLQWRLVDAVFQQSTWMGGSLDWSVVGSEDADGDGRSDLLWRQASTGVTVLRLAGGTSIILGGDRNWSFLRRPGRQVG